MANNGKVTTSLSGYTLVLWLLISCGALADRLAPPLAAQAGIPVRSGTGAEILQAVQHTEVAADLNWQSVEYFSIRINDLQAARDYGRISLGYNHYYADMELEFANVLSPGGELKPVKADALQERVGGSQDFYEDRAQLVFSLPDIAPGAIIEFQYRRKSKTVVMPGLFSEVVNPYWYQPTVGGDGGRVDPVHRAEHTLDYPSSMPLFKQNTGPVTPVFSSAKHGDRRRDHWRWQAMSAIPVEPFQEPVDTLMSRVKISTLTDWSTVSAWSWRLARDKFGAQPEVAAIARSLVAGDASREEKVRAVYAYLQEHVRYVFAHLGRGGYEPHFAGDVMQQGYGDCKDQTILAIALLRELGVTAYPALVVTPRNSRPVTDVVSLIFDHMMVYIPADGRQQEFWMDTTGDRALFPGVSNHLMHQQVLVADGHSGKLVTLDNQLSDNVVRLNLDYYLDDRKHVMVDAKVVMSGIFEQNFRHWWIHNSNRETALEQMMGNLFPDAKSGITLRSTVLNDKSLWQPVTIETQFDFGEFNSSENPLTYGVGVSQVYRLFGGFNSLQIPRERKTRWVDDIRERMEIHATFRGGAFDVPVVMATGVDISNPFFTIHQQGRQKEDGSYQIDIAFVQPSLNLSLPEYENYYEALKNFANAGHWVVRFDRDETAAQRQSLAAADDGSLSAQLAKVRFHLDKGEFIQALAPAQAVVKAHQGSGEAWYLLGLAQGYNAMIDESRKSFARAADLGYTP